MEGHGFEVAPGLHRIEGPLGERFVACYLLFGVDGALLVDTGANYTPEGSILPYAESIGLDRTQIRWIVNTHCDVDHMGGNAALRGRLPWSQFVAHEADVGLIEDVDRIIGERYSEFAVEHGIDIDDEMKAWCREVAKATPIDLHVLGARETIRLGPRRYVELISTPGHSPGSLSVWDPDNRAVVVGDAVLGSTIRRADGRPAFPPTYRHVAEYRSTIAKLEGLHARYLLTSHDPLFAGEAVAQYLDESRSFAVRLEREIGRELLASAPRTTGELIEALAPRMGDWDRSVWLFLATELVGHLEELEQSGSIRRAVDSNGRIQWDALT